MATICLGFALRSTSYPQFPSANRPQYAPRPSSSLIGQIVPSGQPWPANAADYDKFSQTTRRNWQTPVWATSLPTEASIVNYGIPEVDDRRHDDTAGSSPDHKHWSRPTIIFHQPFLRNTTTTMTEPPAIQRVQTTELSSTSSTTSPAAILNTTKNVINVTKTELVTPTVIRQPEVQLFTSAPVKLPDMETKVVLSDGGTVGVANLLPEST